MTKTEALNYFGGASPLARKLDISPHAIYQWTEKVPAVSQWPIAALSNWELMPDADVLPVGFSVDALQNCINNDDPRITWLLTMIDTLAKQRRFDIIDALAIMAAHHVGVE